MKHFLGGFPHLIALLVLWDGYYDALLFSDE